MHTSGIDGGTIRRLQGVLKFAPNLLNRVVAANA